MKLHFKRDWNGHAPGTVAEVPDPIAVLLIPRGIATEYVRNGEKPKKERKDFADTPPETKPVKKAQVRRKGGA